MLRLALVFLIIALLAAIMGFGYVEAVAWEGARLFFWVFIILAVVSFLVGMVRGRPPRDLV